MERLARMQRIRQLQQQAQILSPPPTPTPISIQSYHSGYIGPTSGLVNLGNTCYMNSVIQCFRHCGPLMRYLFGPGFQRDKVCFTNKRPMDLSFIAVFRELMRELETNTKQSAAPHDLLKLIVLYNPIFGGYQQADAQECINTMLQIFHSGLTLNVQIINNPGVGQSEAIELQRLGHTRYATHVQKNGYSVIEEMFGSQFLSKLVCQTCGNVSHAHDAYNIVSVPIPDRALTLYDCIDEFIKPEMVADVTCDRCNSRALPKANAIKQMSFWTLPHVFLVQLKRFDHHLRKIDKFVQAPITLNMSQYITHPRVVNQIQTNPHAVQLYDLRGIVCHSGQLGGGHYTSKCWRPNEENDEGRWIEFNDTFTRVIGDTQELQSNQNYVFFYEMSPATKLFWNPK